MVKCQICGRSFRDKRGLQGHARYVHKMAWKDYQKRFTTEKEKSEKPEKKSKESETPVEEEAEKLKELPPELVETLAEKVADILKGKFEVGAEEPPSELPEGVELIGEAVDVTAEKVNYKIALNPEIFYRYNIFKAKAGERWKGNFSDWLDLVTRDILKVYGLYPGVLTVKGRKLVVELPMGFVEAE